MTSTVLPDPTVAPAGLAMRHRALLAGGAAVIGLLGAVYAADVALSRGEVPRGVTIHGVDLAGRSTDAARDALEAALADDAVAPMRVSVDGSPAQVDPARAGLGLDLDATLDRATAQSLDPVSRVRSFFTTEDVDVVTRVDEAKLRAEITALAAKFDRKPQEGAVRFRGTTPVPVVPQAGITVDVERAMQQVYASYLDRALDAPVGIPADVVPVRSTPDDVQRVLTEVAIPAVSAPVELRTGATTLRLPPSAVARSLVIEADDAGRIVPVVDAKRLESATGSLLEPVEVAPRDARFVFVGEAISIQPSALGREVDVAALAQRLLAAVSEQGAGRVVTLPIVEAEPKISTARAQSLGIKEVIGEGTTFHPCCAPRVRNIHRIADIVNGAIVLPGETFSLNGHVGRRDRKRGFVEAPQILNGEFVDAVGGGVSQFATTMFNAVFFSGLEDVFHKPHSYYISRYPPGREATVSFPEPDLKWRNDSPHGVLVRTRYTDRSITVTFYGTKRYDVIEAIHGPRTRVRGVTTEYRTGRGCEPRGGAPGFDIVVTRVFKQGGREVKRERFFTRYVMETRIVCRRRG